MAGFKKTFWCLTVAVIAAAGASFGCGFAGTSSSASTDISAKATTGNSTPTLVKVKTEQGENDRDAGTDADARSRIRKGVEKRTLFDGSQYVAMRDGYGNKIEYRYFEPETGVKYISLQTTRDGATTIQVRTWDGFTKQVDPSQLADPWRVSARDLAVTTGFPLEYQMGEKAPAAVTAPRVPLMSLPENSIVSKQLETPAKSTAQAGETKPEQLSKPVETQPRQGSNNRSATLRQMLGNTP